MQQREVVATCIPSLAARSASIGVAARRILLCDVFVNMVHQQRLLHLTKKLRGRKPHLQVKHPQRDLL